MNDPYIAIKNKKKWNSVHLIIFGILIFLLFIYPFFGSDWRFSLSNFFNMLPGPVAEKIGTVIMTFGVFVFIWGIFTLLCSNKVKGVGIMIYGFLLILLAGYFMGFELIQFIAGNDPSIHRGYQ